MFKLFKLIVIFAFATCQLWAETPSERFMKDHTLPMVSMEYGRAFENNIPLFLEIMDAEHQKGFFGYHGTSQNFRVYQDIIRSVMEEVLGYAIPEDFYFMRIPGDALFDLKGGKKDFLTMFDRKNDDITTQNALIDNLFLKPYQKKYGYKTTLGDLTQNDRKLFMKFFDNIASRYHELSLGGAEGLQKKTIYLSNNENDLLRERFHKNVKGEPNERYKKMIFDLLLTIKDTPNNQGNRDYIIKFTPFNPEDYVESFAAMFQRIEKQKGNTTFNLILCKQNITNSLSINHVSGQLVTLGVDNYPVYSLVKSYFFPVNDTTPNQQARLIAINIPLFGNYKRWDESTLTVFLEDSSISSGDNKGAVFLKNWFDEIGIDKNVVDKLYKLAFNELGGKHNTQSGCIIQFFDLSNKQYRLCDEHVYLAYPFGVPAKDSLPSQVLTGKKPLNYIASYYGQLQRQLRLVTSNEVTLNPYGGMLMIRYDSYGNEVARRIIYLMKEELSKHPVDQYKINLYKNKLSKTWDLLN